MYANAVSHNSYSNVYLDFILSIEKKILHIGLVFVFVQHPCLNLYPHAADLYYYSTNQPHSVMNYGSLCLQQGVVKFCDSLVHTLHHYSNMSLL